MKIKSTKSYWKLPCSHMQFQDTDITGVPFSGPCSKWHGYDRSVHFEFSGTPDEFGWIVGFGDLKSVKGFLEYYLDHVALAPANDPRMADIRQAYTAGLVDLRILPYGVSMEMTSLFIWEHVNPYIYEITQGRTVITKVECREHDSNSAFIEVPFIDAKTQAIKYVNDKSFTAYLPCKMEWEYESPRDALNRFTS